MEQNGECPTVGSCDTSRQGRPQWRERDPAAWVSRSTADHGDNWACVLEYVCEIHRERRRWLSLFARNLPRLLRAHLGVEDIYQEVILTVLRRHDSFRGQDFCDFQAWLIGVAVGTMENELRKARRRESHVHVVAFDQVDGVDVLEAEAGRLRELESKLPDPAATTAADEARRALYRAVTALPDPLMVVFSLRHILGCSVQDIARTLEIESALVSSRLAHARRRLQPALKEWDPGSI